jgi:hypothetical protein
LLSAVTLSVSVSFSEIGLDDIVSIFIVEIFMCKKTSIKHKTINYKYKYSLKIYNYYTSINGPCKV